PIAARPTVALSLPCEDSSSRQSFAHREERNPLSTTAPRPDKRKTLTVVRRSGPWRTLYQKCVFNTIGGPLLPRITSVAITTWTFFCSQCLGATPSSFL